VSVKPKGRRKSRGRDAKPRNISIFFFMSPNKALRTIKKAVCLAKAIVIRCEIEKVQKLAYQGNGSPPRRTRHVGTER